MKKVKWIALALVLCLGLIGGAYASWMDHTELSASVKTGTFGMDVIQADALQGDEADYMSVTVDSPDDKTVTADIENLYPVERRYDGAGVHLRIENTGSVPVKLESVDFVKDNPDSPAWDDVRSMARFQLRETSAAGAPVEWTLPELRQHLEDLGDEVMDYLEDKVIEPDNVLRFGGCEEDPDENTLYIYIDGRKDHDPASQGEDIGFTLTFNWVQYNKP